MSPVLTGPLDMRCNLARLEGKALSLYRQERGVSLESLAKGNLALAEA